jgi:hypothetical protein
MRVARKDGFIFDTLIGKYTPATVGRLVARQVAFLEIYERRRLFRMYICRRRVVCCTDAVAVCGNPSPQIRHTSTLNRFLSGSGRGFGRRETRRTV